MDDVDSVMDRLAISDLWTLEQLSDRVAEALSVKYDGQPNRRVTDIPNPRAIRWYTTIGLVDPPEMHGRIALYRRRHLLQLVAVKRLQAAGKRLAEVQQELLGSTEATLERIARLPDDPASLQEIAQLPGETPARTRFWATRPIATSTDDDSVTVDTSTELDNSVADAAAALARFNASVSYYVDTVRLGDTVTDDTDAPTDADLTSNGSGRTADKGTTSASPTAQTTPTGGGSPAMRDSTTARDGLAVSDSPAVSDGLAVSDRPTVSDSAAVGDSPTSTDPTNVSSTMRTSSGTGPSPTVNPAAPGPITGGGPADDEGATSAGPTSAGPTSHDLAGRDGPAGNDNLAAGHSSTVRTGPTSVTSATTSTISATGGGATTNPGSATSTGPTTNPGPTTSTGPTTNPGPTTSTHPTTNPGSATSGGPTTSHSSTTSAGTTIHASRTTHTHAKAAKPSLDDSVNPTATRVYGVQLGDSVTVMLGREPTDAEITAIRTAAQPLLDVVNRLTRKERESS